jgi:hypothetical protein
MTKLWHNIDARRLDAPLIQAAGIFLSGCYAGYQLSPLPSNVVK